MNLSEACRKYVLIVDDDVDLRDALIEVVGDQGHAVLAASNGREALDLLRARGDQPCVILLDVMMPQLDGWGFRHAQTSDPELASVPVILLSAHANLTDTAQKMGAAAYLKKPVELDALLAAVDQFC